jgi:hypothetical protein
MPIVGLMLGLGGLMSGAVRDGKSRARGAERTKRRLSCKDGAAVDIYLTISSKNSVVDKTPTRRRDSLPAIGNNPFVLLSLRCRAACRKALACIHRRDTRHATTKRHAASATAAFGVGNLATVSA